MNEKSISREQANLSFWFVLAGTLIYAGMWYTFRLLPHPEVVATLFMAGAILASGWGLFGVRSSASWHPIAMEFLLWLILATGLADIPWHAGALRRLLGNPPENWVVLFAVIVCIALAAAMRKAGPRGRCVLLGLFLLIFCVRNYMDITRYPDRVFDVIMFHQQASEWLLHGINPFHGPMPLYTPYEVSIKIYDPEVVRGQTVISGYVYPPVALLSGLPGYWLFGEFRLAIVAEFFCAGILLYCLLPTRVGLLVASAFLLSPASRLMVFFGWTEVFCCFYGVLAVCSYLWWPRFAPYAFGLLLSSKQTVPLLLPGLWMFLRSSPPREGVALWMGKCIGFAAIILLPFFLWGPGDFFFSLISMHVQQPLRHDTISFGPLLFTNTPSGRAITGLFSIALYLAVVAAGYLGGVVYKGLAGWCAWSGLTFMIYFICNKQGFANYYFFSFMLLLLAMLVCERESSGRISMENERGIPFK